MIWGFKIVFAFFLVSLTAAQGPSPLCGSNPDGKTTYENVINNSFPKLLADYNAVISAFPDANATPEDVDVSTSALGSTSKRFTTHLRVFRASIMPQKGSTELGLTVLSTPCGT
jgi:hypothetical protein